MCGTSIMINSQKLRAIHYWFLAHDTKNKISWYINKFIVKLSFQQTHQRIVQEQILWRNKRLIFKAVFWSRSAVAGRHTSVNKEGKSYSIFHIYKAEVYNSLSGSCLVYTAISSCTLYVSLLLLSESFTLW